jgi:hypothetical protein
VARFDESRLGSLAGIPPSAANGSPALSFDNDRFSGAKTGPGAE